MEKPFSRKIFTNSQIAAVCLVFLLLSLIPLFVLSFYNYPCEDDFNYGLYASQAVKSGGPLLEVISAAARKTAETYGNWQGTYSAVFLMSMHPAVFGERFYSLTVFIMIGSLLISTFYFLKTLCTDRLRMPVADAVIVACAVSFFCVQFPRSAFEGFFWFNGSVFYTFFHALMLCLLALILRFLKPASTRSAALSLAAALLLSAAIGGGNYPTALLSSVILAGVTVFAFVKRFTSFKKIGVLSCFLMESAGFLISIIAPGNSVRQSYFDSRPGAVEAVFIALKSAVQSMLEWTALPMLLMLLFITPLLYRCASRLSFRFRFPLLAPLFSVCVLAIQMTPPIYAMGGTGGYRMQNMYYFTYCLLAVGTVFYLCGWFSKRFAIHCAAEEKHGGGSVRAAFVISLAGLFICVLLCLPGFRSVSSVSALLSIKNGEAQSYRDQMEERLAVLQDPEIEEVILSPLTVRPELLMPGAVPGLSENPDEDINRRVAEFYGKKSVVEKP